MKRFKISKGKSKRIFKKTSGIPSKNNFRGGGLIDRGGIRL